MACSNQQNVPIIVKKEVDKCGGFLTVIGMKQLKGVSAFE